MQHLNNFNRDPTAPEIFDMFACQNDFTWTQEKKKASEAVVEGGGNDLNDFEDTRTQDCSSQGRYLASTVLCVPSSLDSGRGNIIRTSICVKCSASTKITTQLAHISRCKATPGINWWNRWTNRVVLMNTLTLSHIHTLMHTHAHSLSLSPSLSLPPPLSHTQTHTHTHTLSLSLRD